MKIYTKKLSFFIMILFVSCLVSCKKDNEPGLDKRVIGKWANVQEYGLFFNRVTNLEFHADGKGNEKVTQIRGTSVTILQDEPLQWTCDNVKVLKYTVNGQEEGVFEYSFEDNDKTLNLKNSSGAIFSLYRKTN